MISDAKLESYSNYDCKVVLTRLPLELTRTICKMVKSPKEELKCQICEAKFKTNQQMNLHMTSVHEERKPHTCECCERSFSMKQSLDKHIAYVHGGKKRLPLHKSKAHCVICNEEFSSKKYLSEHVSAIHEEKILFNCEICNKGFKWGNSYKVHISTVHEENKTLVVKFVVKTSKLKEK